MEKVEYSEYPRNREWDSKVNSMPNIPRGDDGMLAVLKVILVNVQKGVSPNEKLTFSGSNTQLTLNELCVRLRPMKLVEKTEIGWKLSEESEKWLYTGDDMYLAAVLCSNIKFLGEILFYLDTEKKAADLQRIALEEYELGWRTYSDINARLVWLRLLGMVDFQEFSLQYSITDRGRELLNYIHVEELIIKNSVDETEDEDTIDISKWAGDLLSASQMEDNKRKQSIGYIPGNIIDFDHTIAELLDLVEQKYTYLEILDYMYQNHKIKTSSMKSTFSMLTNANLIKRKTDELFELTPIGIKWFEKKSSLDLLCIFHHQFLFIFEMLAELHNKSMTYKELAATAKLSYGFKGESIDEIRRRISILKKTNLVRNSAVDKFTSTHRAEVLVGNYAISTKNNFTKAVLEQNADNPLDEFLKELRVAATASSEYERLEKAVKTAFEYLGFSAKWYGGSGKTDVLIHSTSAPKYSYSVTVDAKSTQTGNVSENAIDFDTLEEHRKKHHATYSAVVGGKFTNERLINRAKEHGVVLFDIDSLEKLIKDHMTVPLKVDTYRRLFETPGIVECTVLDGERNKIVRQGVLMRAIIECLLEESEDEVTGGLLQERDIYRTLRGDDRFEASPSLVEITNILDFLSSPLLTCVEKTKDGYYIIGSATDVKRKLEFYATSCIKSVEI